MLLMSKLSATKLYGIHLPNYPCKTDWWRVTWNFESNRPRWSEIANFRSILFKWAM